MTELVANASIIQPIDAQMQAQEMPKALAGSPDASRLPSMMGADLDEILEVGRRVFAPLGREPSRFANTDEYEQFASQFGRCDSCFGLGDRTGMTLETPFGKGILLLTNQGQ
jgi:hypothetical protein